MARKKQEMRRKHAIQQAQHGEELANLNQFDNIQVELRQVEGTEEEAAGMVGGRSTQAPSPITLEIVLLSNAAQFRISATVRQAILAYQFTNRYASPTNSRAQAGRVNNAGNHQLTNSFDHFLDEEIKFGLKSIPKVISLGLNVILDIIKDTYEQNPKICIRSLESLYNLLQGLKPESLKYEPYFMIEKFFELISTLISLSYSAIGRKYNPLILFDNYQSQVFELSLLSFITLSIARGDTSKILNCIKILLIECNDSSILLDNYNSHNGFFDIEIPEIMILLQKNVCSFLLGRFNVPEWHQLGFPTKSLCELFGVQYTYHQKNLNKIVFNPKTKAECPTSLTFDGQHLILYRCKRLFLIASGYNNSQLGQEIFSAPVDISNLKERFAKERHEQCCSGGWVGYINGELFLQPNLSWSCNQIMHLDAQSFRVKSIVTLISDYSEKSPFLNPTLATTDGEFLIIITVIQDDFVMIRELKPLKLNLETSQMNEKLNFSLVTEFTVRLSSMHVAYCGSSTTLVLPSFSTASIAFESYKPNKIQLIDSSQLFEAKDVIALVPGKDFALVLNEQGKVYYMGNSASLGLRHVQFSDRWLMLTIPKPVKIVQVAVGHEGNHALLLSDDATVFFVGLAKRGEDGESFLRGCRVSKPCRVKKFAKIESSQIPIYVACNHATSAIVLKSGELYLFGKDSQHANSKSKVGLPKDFEVKTIALGKAHMLILSQNGLVATSGFSNKGQCGTTQIMGSVHDSPKHAVSSNMEASLDSKLKISGHVFAFGKCRRCSLCANCTEYGSKCPMMINSFMPLVEGECGCGEGNSGCVHCGVCPLCAQINTICKRDRPALEHVTLSKSFQTVESRHELSQHRKLSSRVMGNPSNEAELEMDSSSKITSLPPTVLLFSQENPVLQIAAGLHHSVLLTEKGEVYTFGSNQFGQLGMGDFSNRCSPTRVKIEFATRGFVVQIAAGSNHTVLLTSIGEVLTFGNNQNGQLGRSCYNSCKLDYQWNSFPGKMDNVGPEYGRMVSYISANGDFTFVKYYEMLLSSNLLTQAKLMAEKNCLILVPPQVNKCKSFDDLFEENSCKHYFCRNEPSTSTFNTQSMFNNLNANVLVISRSNGFCSILNPVATLRTLPEKKRFLSETEVKNQVDFESFSSILIDKFYNNFWTYNSIRDEFSRFNLMTLEISSKMLTLASEKTLRGQLPTSLLKLCQLSNLQHPSIQFLKHVPSPIQPDLAIPLSDHCLLKQRPQQMALELFSSLTSLTYSHLLGLSVNDKMEQLNYLARTFLPEEYTCVNRFEDYGGGWGYPPNSVEAIRFSVDSEIILGGIGLYGGRGEYTVQIRLFDLGNDADVERDGDLLSETDVIHYECLPRQKYQVFFDDPILIQPNRWYAVWASITGPSSDCGSVGQPFVCSTDQVMFHFKQSKMANNGTDVNAGQIPVLFYRPIKSNEISLHYNNSTHNLTSLSLDDEGLPFSISKDFVLKINSCCIFSLCDILRHVWQSLRSLLVGPKLTELFSTDEEEKLLDRLNNLILEVKKLVYTACFALDLIRAYTQIFLPANECEIENQNNKKSGSCSHYSQIQKFLNYDYDEYKRIANSFFEACNLLTAILLDPIELAHVIGDKLVEGNHWHSTRHRLLALLQLSHFFTDECYQTFQACCYAFYPTHALKWSVLCDFLSPVLHLPLQSESPPPMFTNRQLYLLSSLLKAFNVQSIRLISFFPVQYGSIYDSFEDFPNVKELMNPVLDISDLSCHVITKKLSEFFTYDDLYLSKSYTCNFVYESLLNIVVHPIRYMIEHIEDREKRPETADRSYENYCQFGTGFSEANTNTNNSNVSNSNPGDLSSPSSSSSTTSDTFEDEDNEQPNPSHHLSSHSVPKDSSPDSSFKELVDAPFAIPQIYAKRLVNAASDILLKFISEYSASALGLITNNNQAEPSTMFVLNSEYVTPSRFCRRSSNKCWEAGSGSPEAICFSINKSGIHISGVRVYSSTIGQFKYQLQLLDQAFDDNKTEKSNFTWKTLASVSGVYSYEENSSCRLNDLCELRFERPIMIKPNIKYAVVFKNYSTYSYSGDMGLPQVRGDDDTLFTFMDCSLSKNGTNLNRGQIPQILYYNLPGGFKAQQLGEEEQYLHRHFNSSVARESIVQMFQMVLEQVRQVIQAVREALENHANTHASLNSSHTSPPQSSFESNQEALEILCATFDSVLLNRFVPHFIMHMHQLKLNCRLCYQMIHSVRSLIPALSSLNKTINSQFYVNESIPLTTSPHYLVVESDHPYKPATVTTYLVKFPSSVKWITVEFDPKCSTAQPEDYLELYIPNEQYVSFSGKPPDSPKDNSNSFKNLQLIYRRFSGRNFDSHILRNESGVGSSLSKCILVPGNELVFMLKTSSDYVHSANRSSDAYFGFRAEVIGYVLPNKVIVDKEILSNTDLSNWRKENLSIYVRQIIQNFENDLVYLFGLCIDTLLNASPDSIIVDLSEIDSVFNSKLSPTDNFELKKDVNLTQEIFLDNFSLLSKGFNFDQPLTMEMVKQCSLSSSSINSFLDDFIKLTPQSSGARLALWFQNDAFILPGSCLINVIESLDECCSQCTILLETDSFCDRTLCGRCHYQLFVKTLTQTFDCHHVSLGSKLFIKVVTRDQHEEIAFDSNALIELNIRYMSLCSGQKPNSSLSVDHDFSITSPLLNTLSEHPYQVTIKDKSRYHAISMMKVYDNYTFEELRYYTQSLFQKKTTMEKVSVRSFDNGYYLASWTPNITGYYKVELIVDGEASDHAYLIKVNQPTDPIEDLSSQPIIGDSINFTKINLCDQIKGVDRKLGEKRKPRHCIRKFVCHDSAGLRIRALPSMQSEQIGIVAVSGLLTIVDLVENDDGVWVRLSNESIQAYCSNSIEVFHQSQVRADNDNSESNLTGELLDGVMKQSFTFTLRTEAWALQFNRHFNRTLLVPIDSEDDVNNEYVLAQTVSLPQPNETELMVPSWFEVVNCSQDGHLIRNWPSLDELSIIIGIVPIHHMVHAVETVHNSFGLWVRLSQDSLYSCISALYKSTFFESNIEGWMLVQSVNGLLYMQTTIQQIQPAKAFEHDLHQPELINNKYNVNDENAYIVPVKTAISNRAAQCIRAIFATFVWHEGILHDVLTAASYLKFNAEITKEFVKFCEINDNVHQNKAASVCRSNRKSCRQKTVFRHSVEVSQLFTHWSSDVNSNISDMIFPSLIENNNNNEESVSENEKPEQTDNELATMIPEILISLLQIWEFVSSECLRVISYYSDANRPSLVPFRLTAEATDNNNEVEIQWKHCKPCYCKMTSEGLEGEHSLMGQIMESFSNKYANGAASEPCKCDKQKCPNKEEVPGNEEQPWRKHVRITSISHLYSLLDQSSHFLLSLAPTNAPSLTDVAIDENLAEKGLLSQCQNAELLLEDFRVDEQTLFQSLTHLGIQKSSYEKKLAEEKLSDLAVLSIQQAEDHQHLLSPEYFEGWKNIIESDPESVSSIGKKSIPPETAENKKTFKFYRSISVGLNYSSNSASSLWSQRNSNQQLWSQLISKSPKHNKSSDALIQDASDDKFNVPFLCKPSSRLMGLVQKYVQVEGGQTIMFTIDEVMPTPQSLYQNMHSDVLKFIFSCYNVDMLRSVSHAALCAAAYRALALHILNWLVVHVTSPSSLHDLMWTFVNALLPEPKQTSAEECFEETNDKIERKFALGDVCRHPFHGLVMAGESAEHWISEGLHQLIRSLADLLPLLPMGSPLQQMAMRCFGIDFLPRDHIHLHECKVFRHISTILTRASLDEPVNFDIDLTSSYKDKCGMSTVNIAKDVTNVFELRASSRSAMLPSLLDNSTETFWESGHEDRSKLKHISIVSPNRAMLSQAKRSYLKFVYLYLDNTRDQEYKVSHVAFKLKNVEDIEKWSLTSNLMLRQNDSDILEAIDVDCKFVGWLQCELNIQQSRQLANGKQQIRIELSGTGQYVRVRQVKVFSVPLNVEHLQCELKNECCDTVPSPNCYQIQTSNCEAETLRVFRLLTAQVFGKLLSTESNQSNSIDEKRLSFYQQNLNDSDLREHMVGILFSQSGKLSELQKQVCSHIVREIHCESTRVREEWNLLLGMSSGSRRLSSQLPYDSYCFELLSLVLALSGSSVGCSYLSRQRELLYDMLTLLHTSSDRVKRQVLALIRRVLSSIKPVTFAQMVGITEVPSLSDIFAKIHGSSVDEGTVLCHVGVLDFFLSCIGKALSVQTKVKGFNSKSRYQAVHSMETTFDEHNVIYDQWWLRGSISKQIAQSILFLLKEMTSGAFGKEWSELASNCIAEKILNLTRLSEPHRIPEKCMRTPTLWLALAALCALEEKDAEMLSSSHLSRYHDQANGNACQIYCDNHDDGETVAFIQCSVCGNLCADCDRFLHLNPRTRGHKRHIFKEEVDSIKVDIHEGCGRVKFFWSLVVADSKLLKAMVEFRNCGMKKSTDGKLFAPDDDSLSNQKTVDKVKFSTGVCRFCGSQDSQGVLAIGNVCNAEDCQRFALEACEQVLGCGHFCCGIANEITCLPCLHGCSGNLKQDGDDMCMICFSESLFAAPCIQFLCKHVFHRHCVQAVLEKRWSGGRIVFTFSQCPICKVTIEHPSLFSLLLPIQKLYQEVKQKARIRLEYENLHKCEAITTPGARFYNDPDGFAMEKYSYYLCFKCGKAYFGGEARCDAEYDGINFNPEELICGSCSDVTQAQICPKHGTEFLEYKCRFCCSVAVYFCFGSTHFCNACHDDFQRLVILKDYPKCPVGPRCVPHEGNECPLHVAHPPTGEEFALGCGICRNTHTF